MTHATRRPGARPSGAMAPAGASLRGIPLLLALVAPGTAGGDERATPWWDEFPTLIQTGASATAVRAHAVASLCGGADDPTWGIFGQRQRIATAGRRVEELHAAGLRALTWIEGFGTCQMYIAQLRRDRSGAWVRGGPGGDLTRIFHQHWSWHRYDGSGERRWIGPQSYFDDLDFARPFTRSHPRYGCPPMRYPDGRIATGHDGPPDDPRGARVLDAGGAKGLDGSLSLEHGFRREVNAIDPSTGRPRGPIAGLLRVEEPRLGPPDPGYTPEEWRRLHPAAWAGGVNAGKDSACPVWIDYAEASARQAIDAGIDGVWVDNFSPWDSFGSRPIDKAFGDWSVARFPAWLRARLSTKKLRGLGMDEAERLDIREHLRTRCRALGGNPDDLRDPRWRDPRWLEDPLWRAYLVYKRQTGTEALRRLWLTLHRVAAEAGKPDFLVMGNDTPIFSLGWVRGQLDMVSTELSWGWGLTTGPRGLMPPPRGSYVPVYRLAREHARSRFVSVWMYGPGGEHDRPDLTRVLYYQALSSHALPMPNPGGRTVGGGAGDGEFFAFVRRVAPLFAGRRPVEEVGLYYSSSSQLTEMLPGGFRDHADQPHSFSFWGWGTALTWLHVPWRAVPEWKLNTETLRGLRALIIPEARVLDEGSVPTVEEWVEAGGSLIVAGTCGERRGELASFERVRGAGPLGRLTGLQAPDAARPEGSQPAEPRRRGRGAVLVLRPDPGRPFYLADAERPSLLPAFTRALEAAGTKPEDLALSAPDAPSTVGLTLYRDGPRLFVDIQNTAVDPSGTGITPTGPLEVLVRRPPDLENVEIRARVITPDPPVEVEIETLPNGQIAVRTGSVEVYASVVLEAR